MALSGMAQSIVKFSDIPLPGLIRGTSNEIYPVTNEFQEERNLIKEENFQKSACLHVAKDWPRQEAQGGIEGVKQCKTEQSSIRSASPEFLLEASADGKKNEDYEANEIKEGTPDKGDSMNSVDDVTTPPTCVYCNIECVNKSSLELHLRTMHSGKNVYDCPMCDKRFSHRSSRNIHLRSHTGQRPYGCEICKKRFRVSSHLRDHVRTHTGERPFKCLVCGRGFKQSSDMKKHRKTHNKTSPTNGKTKLVNFKKERLNEHKLETSYMIVRPDDMSTNNDENTTSEIHSPTERKNLKLVIKVERKAKDQVVSSPLSCDSGVKLESDNSNSPENVPGSNKFHYQELPKQTSTANESVASSRWSAANGTLGHLNYNSVSPFKETEPLQYLEPRFFRMVPIKNENDRSINEDNARYDNTRKRRMQEKKLLDERSLRKNLRDNSVAMETQNGENTTEHVREHEYSRHSPTYVAGGPTYTSDVPTMVTSEQSRFYRFGQPSASVALGNVSTKQTNEENRTQNEDTTPETTNIQNEVAPMDEQTTVSSQNPNIADSPDLASVVSKPEVVRQPVVVKLRSDKTVAPLKRNGSFSTKKQARPVKKGRDNTMQCSTCLERFRSLETLTAHRCGETEKSFKCSVCGKVFARSTLLRQHMVLHQGSKRFKFKCTYCGRAFRHRSHLRDHERIHTGERPFKCSFCPKAFKQSSDLRKHENLHTGATRYRCEKCAVDFKRCDALKKHAMMHAEGEVTVLKCEKCQSLFATSDGHLSHVCQNKNRFRCQLCVRRFSSAASLRQHCHGDHGDQSNETSLKCEFCNLELQSLDELELHLGTHQLIKTHKCNVCDQRFSLICQLEEHMKTHNHKQDTKAGQVDGESFPMTDYSAPSHVKPQLYEENKAITHKPEPLSRFEDRTENPLEMNTTPMHSGPVPSSPTEPVRQKYDFIPSSYQSLVERAPYGYVENKLWTSPPGMNAHLSYNIPRLVKPQEMPQARRGSDSHWNQTDEAKRPTTTMDDRHPMNSRTPPATADRVDRIARSEPQVGKVELHFQEHRVPKRKYTCLNCRHEFFKESDLVDHVCNIQAEIVYRCLVCDTEFVHYEDLQGHMRKHWRTVVYIKCSLCGERLQNEDRLKEHNLKHMDDRAMKQESLEPGPENDISTIPQTSPHDGRSRTLSATGKLETTNVLPVSGSLSSTFTSYSTPVITSVSSKVKGNVFSKTVSPARTKSSPSERSFVEPSYPEKVNEGRSHLKSPHLQNKSAGNHERNFNANQSDKAIPMTPHSSYVTYFDARKPMPGAYLNVFGQGPAIVVSPMHTMYQRVLP